MNPVIVIHDDEGDCTLPLLSKLTAIARVPSLSEVLDILPDLNLEGHCKGLLSLVMQQPGLQVVLGRFMGLLDHLASTVKRLKSALEVKKQSESLLSEEQAKVASLLEANATLQTSLQWQEALIANSSVFMQQVSSERDAALAEVARCQETIKDLEEQLEAKAAVESMAPHNIDLGFLDDMGDDSSSVQPRPNIDLDFLDDMVNDSSSVQSAGTANITTDFSSAREAKMQKEAEESAAAAEEALQKSATLEEKLQKEQEFSAWLVQQRAKAENAAAAAAQEASAEVEHSKQLQEQLQCKDISCTSLIVALASERVARTRADRRAAECEQKAREHAVLTATLALQRNRTIKAEQLSGDHGAAVAEEEIRELKQQLEARAVTESMAPLPINLDFLYEAEDTSSPRTATTEILSKELAHSCAREAQLQKESEGKEVAVAAALQQSAFLKAQLQDERECHAWLAQQHEQAQDAAAAAAEEAGAEAQRNKKLQEQLKDTKSGCMSLAVALSSEQMARMKAEQQASACQQRARDHTALMASLALQQTKAIQAGQRERQALRSRLRALEDECRDAATVESSNIDINISNPSTTPADPAAASSGSSGASAGRHVARRSKGPRGLLRAAITGAAIATAMTEVTLKTGAGAARCLWSSATGALAAAF